MRERESDGWLQISAAMSLLKFSRLIQWEKSSAKFAAVQHDLFESCWRSEIDPLFGRLICWINFSAGAEFLAKGVCLIRGVEIRKRKKGGGTDFGTLGNLYGDDPPNNALRQLCKVVNADKRDEDARPERFERPVSLLIFHDRAIINSAMLQIGPLRCSVRSDPHSAKKPKD